MFILFKSRVPTCSSLLQFQLHVLYKCQLCNAVLTVPHLLSTTSYSIQTESSSPRSRKLHWPRQINLPNLFPWKSSKEKKKWLKPARNLHESNRSQVLFQSQYLILLSPQIFPDFLTEIIYDFAITLMRETCPTQHQFSLIFFSKVQITKLIKGFPSSC